MFTDDTIHEKCITSAFQCENQAILGSQFDNLAGSSESSLKVACILLRMKTTVKIFLFRTNKFYVVAVKHASASRVLKAISFMQPVPA